MTRYVLSRVGQSAVAVFGLAAAAFFILHLVPGDPARQALGPKASQAAVDALRSQLGLDRPLVAQFITFLADAAQGNFGTSVTTNLPVAGMVSARLLPTVELVLYGLIVAVVIAVPLAIFAASRPNGVVDNVARIFVTFVYAMPTFWLGLMLALLFGLQLRLLPVSGYSPGLGSSIVSLTLPAVTLGLSLTVIIVRTLRSNLLDISKLEYVEAARSRGFSTMRVLLRHALRNAVVPTLTIISVAVGFLIGGTVVIESVFQLPGIGSLLVQSVLRRDYGVVQEIVIVSGVSVIVLSLITDIVQALIDPRVKLSPR
jgi:peptide/nickel transport system permease protein